MLRKSKPTIRQIPTIYIIPLVIIAIIIVMGGISLFQFQEKSTFVITLTEPTKLTANEIIVSLDPTHPYHNLPDTWTPTYTYTPTELVSEDRVLTLTTTKVIDVEITNTPVQNDFPTACPFVWARDEVPNEHMETLHIILRDLGYTGYDLTAIANGESSCGSFFLMSISAKISLSVDQTIVSNPSEMGKQIRQIMTALVAETTLPGISRIEIEFVANLDSTLWSLSTFDYKRAVADGVDDVALYNLGL